MKPKRSEVIIAGSGGQGVVVAGDVICITAMEAFRHVSGIPVFGGSKRGGLCEATVIFSDEEISSPFIEQAQAVLVLDSTYFNAYESRVRSGGVVIADKTGLPENRSRNDYELYELPVLEAAAAMGDMILSNMIMLGAYVSISGSLSAELVERELNKRYARKEKALKQNTDAFRKGVELGKAASKRTIAASPK